MGKLRQLMLRSDRTAISVRYPLLAYWELSEKDERTTSVDEEFIVRYTLCLITTSTISLFDETYV
jgi:hypothetical protein